jgi:uncharacterized protein YjbI with pentapeptide repeats
MSITPDQLPAILEGHRKWARGEAGGARANLSGADLSWANLSRANLSGANLSGAKINNEEVSSWASVQFSGHGQCGRTLLAIKAGETTHLRCGCFSGSPADLRGLCPIPQDTDACA